jgi:hypothetical protein
MRHMSRRLQRNAMLVVAASALAAGVVLASAAVGDGGPGRPDRARHDLARAHARAGNPRRHPGIRGGEVRLAATYLQLTRAQLRTQLRSGRTLAQIADASSGKSASRLIDALVSAKDTRLSAAASDGKLSQPKARARLARVRTRVTLQVNSVRRLHRRIAPEASRARRH